MRRSERRPDRVYTAAVVGSSPAGPTCITAGQGPFGAPDLRLQRVHRTSASKIAVSEAAVGELCGLDGVEADGVAQTVGVAGDAS
jgi:hypothetical protein